MRLLTLVNLQHLDIRDCRSFCHKDVYSYLKNTNSIIKVLHDYDSYLDEPYHCVRCKHSNACKRMRFDRHGV